MKRHVRDIGVTIACKMIRNVAIGFMVLVVPALMQWALLEYGFADYIAFAGLP